LDSRVTLANKVLVNALVRYTGNKTCTCSYSCKNTDFKLIDPDYFNGGVAWDIPQPSAHSYAQAVVLVEKLLEGVEGGKELWQEISNQK
jgi:hypothetical protein